MNNRAAVLAAGAVSALLFGCGPQAPELSADQTLRLAIPADVDTFDPAQMSQPSVAESLARNVFGGLYKFTDRLEEVPDIAEAMPVVSADGLTWTFKLRTTVRFSNGDPVRAQDFVYSWSRAASFHNGDAFIFEPVRGYDEVQGGKESRLAGLSAPDPQTLIARLAHPAGYWMVELGLWPAWVIDGTVVKEKGDATWWSTPDGLVGTGPFRMVRREPGKSIDFEPVPNWWGGSNATLHVHAEVVSRPADQVNGYEQGRYDIVGYTPDGSGPFLPDDLLSKYRQSSDRVSRPWLKSEYVLFNFRSGPFSDRIRDRDGRRAFSLAIDRKEFAQKVCRQATTCQAATGGIIVKGLQGYLGDGGDPNATFDPAQARAALKRWDPDGSRVRGLKLAAPPGLDPIAAELVRQWKQNLLLDIGLDIPDRSTFRAGRAQGIYPFFLSGFLADYDSPFDWLVDLFPVPEAASAGWTGYRNPSYEALRRTADASLPQSARSDYLQIGKTLADDAAYIALDYTLGNYLVKPYIRGAGGNALYEYYWIGISIRKH